MPPPNKKPTGPDVVRAGLWQCESASSWNSGNGLAWNGTAPFNDGLTLREFVTLNAKLSAVKAVGVLIGRYS